MTKRVAPRSAAAPTDAPGRRLWPVHRLVLAARDATGAQAQDPALRPAAGLARNTVHHQQVVVMLLLDGVGAHLALLGPFEQLLLAGLDHGAQWLAVQGQALLDLVVGQRRPVQIQARAVADDLPFLIGGPLAGVLTHRLA